ncbi:UDP-N-acetylglucosamine 2-epimerase [Polaribacter sp. DS7-9]|nr:UDP-N-acetylglucosamine 2-epimerase [Polaribacter sp. DS7-9]
MEGTVKLVGTNQNVIIKEAINLLDSRDAYNTMFGNKNPYGNGAASMQIVSVLKQLTVN